MVDDRVLGTEESKESLYKCTVPDCDQKLKSKVIPDCPDHEIPMQLVSTPTP